MGLAGGLETYPFTLSIKTACGHFLTGKQVKVDLTTSSSSKHLSGRRLNKAQLVSGELWFDVFCRHGDAPLLRLPGDITQS